MPGKETPYPLSNQPSPLSPSPSPWQPPNCFLSVELPFLIVYTNGRTHYVAFCAWLPSFAKGRWKKRERRISFVRLTLWSIFKITLTPYLVVLLRFGKLICDACILDILLHVIHSFFPWGSEASGQSGKCEDTSGGPLPNPQFCPCSGKAA